LPFELEPALRGHGFFAGLEPEFVALIAGCAKNVVYPAGQFLFREGEPAERFYLIRTGQLMLEIAAPGRKPVVVQAVGPGEVAGFSWLIEARVWHFDGRAVERVHAVEVDGACLQGKCDDDPRLGYKLMSRFAALASRRLQATELRLLDVYGHVGAS